MDWNNSGVKEYTVNVVKSCFDTTEAVTVISAHFGEAVSKEALKSAWRRWRAKDKKLKKLKDVLGEIALDGNDVLNFLQEVSKEEIQEIEDRLALESLYAEEEEEVVKPKKPTYKGYSKNLNPRIQSDSWDDMPFKKGKTFKVIVIPDMQVPYEDKTALAAVEAYMADETWDEYINMGDFMDFDCISSHNKVNLRAVANKELFSDYEAGNKVLDRHQDIVRKNNPDARFVLLEGNHDFRVERFIDEHPQTRGLLEVEHCLRLKERGFRFVRCYAKGELYKLGKAYFHHGLYCNSNHAKSMVDKFGVNIFYGHVHDLMMHSKVIWGKDQTIVGQSLGCLCDYEQSYIKQNPTNWQHALGIFYFQENGEFTYYTPRIINNKFVAPNGKLYDGNELIKKVK